MKLRAFLIGLFTIPTMGFAETCAIRDEVDSRVARRALSVTFPAGRKLTVVGFEHGDRTFWRKLTAFLKASATLTNADFSRGLHQLLVNVNASGEVLKMARQNLSFLRDRVRSGKQNLFVADEGRMEDVLAFQKLTSDTAAALYSQVWQRGLPASDDYVDALLLLGGAANYLKMTEPSLMKTAAIVGFETDGAQGLETSGEAVFSSARERLAKIAGADLGFLAKMEDTFNQINSIYMDGPYDPLTHDQALRTELQSALPAKYKEPAMAAVEGLLQWMKGTLARDRATAHNMATGTSDGLLFIGQLHLKSVARYLAEECRRSAPAVNPTTPSDSAAAR